MGVEHRLTIGSHWGQGAGRARSLSDLSSGLDALRAARGVGFRELQRRVTGLRRDRGEPGVVYDVIYRALQPGRRRLDVDLIADIAVAVTGDPTAAGSWRRAYELVVDQVKDAQVVDVVAALPTAHPEFVGREVELGRLGQDDDTATVLLVDGMPGAGKTWLVARAARRALGDRTDPAVGSVTGGQAPFVAWVDLRGYDRDRPPADPAAVLGELLRLLGVPVAHFAGLSCEERTQLFREELADRRAVLVLDDAADRDQVLPLLPGSANSVTFVTSRPRLGGVPGHAQTIGVLPPEDSVEMLHRLIGHEHQTHQLVRLADAAAHLPLALALIGSRVRDRPDWTLADHLDRLTENARLLRIEPGVELALDLSYQALNDTCRWMLRTLSLQPVRRMDLGACAALAGVRLDDAATQLKTLQAANLISRLGDNRIELHDLVRTFASNRSLDDDPPQQREAAMFRMATYYTAKADQAVQRFKLPGLATGVPHEPVTSDGVEIGPIGTAHEALAWLHAERNTFVALALSDQQCTEGPIAPVLARALNSYFWSTGSLIDAEVVFSRAVQHATGAERAKFLMLLAGMQSELGLNDQAIKNAVEVEQYGQAEGDAYLQAGAMVNHASCLVDLDPDKAGLLYERALLIADDTNRLHLRALIRTNLGRLRLRQGRLDEAMRWCRESLELGGQTGYAGREGLDARLVIAEIFVSRGHIDRAFEQARQVVIDARSIAYEDLELDGMVLTARILLRRDSPYRALFLQVPLRRLVRENQGPADLARLDQDLANTWTQLREPR
ncbi:hypothetical protein AB0P21_39395 [Kribbella sp. NPDC056861]|uniref:hypothetical protein n=1 Tax=Kribbella sp. NPDC056861 TaxID=3154857 RepID=UPI00341C594E